MATPRFAGPPGTTKAPPFGKSKSNLPAKANAGKRPPIPGSKPKSSKPFAKKGKTGQSGFGGDQSKGY